MAKNLSDVHLFHLPSHSAEKIPYRKWGLRDFCSGKSKGHYTNFSIPSQSKIYVFNKSFDRSYYLVPLIAKCSSGPLSIQWIYTNPNTYLEMSDTISVYSFLILGFLWFLISTIFLINSIMYSQFKIQIHIMFTIISFAKALSLISLSYSIMVYGIGKTFHPILLYYFYWQTNIILLTVFFQGTFLYNKIQSIPIFNCMYVFHCISLIGVHSYTFFKDLYDCHSILNFPWFKNGIVFFIFYPYFYGRTLFCLFDRIKRLERQFRWQINNHCSLDEAKLYAMTIKFSWFFFLYEFFRFLLLEFCNYSNFSSTLTHMIDEIYLFGFSVFFSKIFLIKKEHIPSLPENSNILQIDDHEFARFDEPLSTELYFIE